MRGLLISAGKLPSEALIKKEMMKADCVVAADGGLKYLLDLNLCPDYAIGDFDSIESKYLDMALAKNIKIERFNPEKDFTDTELGLNFLKEKSCDKITMLGATGSRLDHVLGNLSCLIRLYEEKIDSRILDDNNEIRYFERGLIRFKKSNKKYLSVLPVDEVVFSTWKMAYEVSGLRIKKDETRGVSNQILGEEAYIKIEKGSAFIIRSND